MMTEPNVPRNLLERAAAVYGYGSATKVRRPVPLDLVPAAVAPIAPADAEPGFVPLPPPANNRVGTVDRDLLAAGGFMLPDSGATVLAEEFRIVKRQLLLGLGADGEARAAMPPRERMILVASALQDEGKTFCAINLALSIAAEKDFEVLLIDADVARPAIPELLGLEPGPGLIDAIEDPTIDVEACIVRTDIANLSVLPAGRPSHAATELLASDRTRIVLERIAARRTNRVIIFDSPPALAASPASELAHHVGHVVMVVRADRTSETELREAVGLLSGCGDIRLLLNAGSLPSGSRRFGAYYGQEG